MAADVAQDPPGAFDFEEPRWTGAQACPVWPHAEHVDHAPDRTVVDELACEYRTLHMDALAVVDGIFSARVLGDPFDFPQLAQGGERRLVGEVVLAVRP